MNEKWEQDFEWLRVKHYVKDAMGKDDLPDLQTILFLIGVQELGVLQKSFTKEEKQDLMHIAVCSLLSEDGYYTFKGNDQDGWPHWEKNRAIKKISLEEQENLLIEKTINYFNLSREDETN